MQKEKTALSQAIEERGDSFFRPLSTTKVKAGHCPRAVNLFFKNGRGYDFKDLKRQNRGAENLEEGIALHRLIDMWHNHNMHGEELQEPGVILSEHSIRLSEWSRILGEYKNVQKVFSYTDGKPNFGGGAVLGVENELHITHVGSPIDCCDRDAIHADSFFKGTLDLMQYDEEEGVLTLTDYKRQWNILSPTDAANSPQALMYSYAAMQHYPEAIRVVFRFFFTRSGVFRETQYTRSQLEHQLELLQQMEVAIVAKMKRYSEDAIPIAGEQCGLCPFSMTCPVMLEDVVTNGTVRNQNEAVALASKMHLMKRKVSESTLILKEWSSDNGPISIGNDKAYGFTESKSESYEINGKVSAFLERVDSLMDNEDFSRICWPDDLISVKSLALTKLVKKTKAMCEESGDWTVFEALMKHVQPKKNTTFRNHKV